MKIYGHFMSAPSNQVRLTASALGLEADYQHVDLQSGEHKQDEYLSVNPFGRVPALTDGDFRLSESSTICRYLAYQAENDMYPEDIQQRAIVDQWMDFANNHIRSNMSKVLFNQLIAPLMGVEPDERSMVDGRKFLDGNLPHVETALEGNKYLTGDQLTLADTAMMAAMEPFEIINYDLSHYPNISKWRKENMQSDWYKKVHNHYAEEMNA
ncbi:MAG: glutathione S-transferase family protein [bacterium]